MKRIALVLASALALAACQDPSTSSPDPTEQPAAGTGAAAFRLGSAELSALSVTSDSLRVEAWRDGRSISASGSLTAGVQIDGLSREQFERAVAGGRLPFLRRLLRGQGHRLHTFYSGLPSTTPAVQAELYYGERAAVPAFSFLDPQADAYVSDIFGARHTVIDHVQRLPERLPRLFMSLTR